MSFASLKWALRSDDDPLAPPLSAEKWKCLVLLAWRAGDDGRYPADDDKRVTPENLATWANITVDAAGRFMRELRAEGPLRDTGERAGKTGRVAIYEFVAEWAPDARAMALARAAQRKADDRRANPDRGRGIKRGNPDRGTGISDGVILIANGGSATRISDPSIYGVNENQTEPQTKASNGGSANRIADDAPQPLPGEASNPAAPNSTVAVRRKDEFESRNGNGTARVLQRAATAVAAPMPSETPHPRTREDVAREMFDAFAQLCEQGQCRITKKSGISKTALREQFALLAAQGANADTVHAAVPIAQAGLAKDLLPGPKSILPAMRLVMGAHANVALPEADTRPASVAELVTEFRRLCDAGLCGWRVNHVEQATMRRDFEMLVNDRAVSIATMRAALPVAQAKVPKGRLPGPRSMARAMWTVSSEPQTEEANDFFGRPARAAGTFVLGNETRH